MSQHPINDDFYLTRRERELLKIVPDCVTYEEMAQRLGIKAGTVRNSLGGLRRRFHVKTLAALVLKVHRLELL